MAHATSPTEPEAAHGTRRYFVIWIALLVFTALTVVVARIHLGHGAGLIVALAIAVTKASLVALFFMHLYDHGGAARIVLATSLFFVMLLLGLSILDNASRFPLTNPPNDRNLKWTPPGPDILSPMVGQQGTSSRREGERDRAPQEHR
jgi:cytochrome c oxidase subunit IV